MPLELPYEPEELQDAVEELISLLRSDVEVAHKQAWLHQAHEFNYVGEWIMAYEGICETIHYYNIALTQRVYQKIEAVGKQITFLDASQWERLKPLVK